MIDGLMNTEIKPCAPEFEEYLRDESRRTGSAEQILFAGSEEDISGALQASLPITVQGARTGIAAGAVPNGGLILNLSRMNHVGDVEDDRMTVQPGALLTEIQERAKDAGLFFPPDPTETSASIGGMLACNASGAMSYHYGPTRKWVNALRVMLPDGDVVRVQRGEKIDGLSFSLTTESGREISGTLPELNMPDIKSAAGYFIKPDMDLVDLFIGMEGTLGIITEAELLLRPVPPVQQALCAFFPNEGSALKFVRFLRQDLGPVAIELFGHRALDLLRESDMDLPKFPDHAHVNILPRSMEELAQGKALYLKWAAEVVAMGGSVSAEHGIGKIKVPLLETMFGPEGIAAMREVKKMFDPEGVLSPGNLFSEGDVQ